MNRNSSTCKAGILAIVVLGSVGFSASLALAAERHHGQREQDQQARYQDSHKDSRREKRHVRRLQRRAVGRVNTQLHEAQRREAERQQTLERNRARRESVQRQKTQRERSRHHQAQRDRASHPQAQRRQDRREYLRNDADRSRRLTQSQPRWYDNDRYRAPRRDVRTAQWNHWRQRHYISAPRYHWRHDRHSRPWFDYNRYTYISIYRPTYVIPAYGYGDYGSTYYGPVSCGRDVVGAVLGGVAGGLVGAHNGGGGATLGGAIIGAIIGGTLGHAVDLSDQACYGQVLEYVPSNQPVYWESDGTQYQITPLRTYRANSGEYCREYLTYIFIDGREEQAYGTACRQPDGTWRAIN